MRLLGIFYAASVVWGASASPDQIRTAAAKGLAMIQTSQKSWYTKQSCTSCHQQILPAIAVAAVREHGVPFDEAVAKEDATKMLAQYSDLDRAVQYTHVIDPALDDGNHLVAAHAAGLKPNLATA